MKFELKDMITTVLTPALLRHFFESCGYEKTSETDNYEVWRDFTGDIESEVIIPDSTEYSDYKRRIEDIIRNTAKYTESSEFWTTYDLLQFAESENNDGKEPEMNEMRTIVLNYIR